MHEDTLGVGKRERCRRSCAIRVSRGRVLIARGQVPILVSEQVRIGDIHDQIREAACGAEVFSTRRGLFTPLGFSLPRTAAVFSDLVRSSKEKEFWISKKIYLQLLAKIDFDTTKNEP